MPRIVCNIDLDVSVKDDGKVLMAKQGDNACRLISVGFTDCGRPLPIERFASVLLNVARETECHVYEGEVEEGRALFALPDFVLNEAGVARCDVSAVSPGGGRLTTSEFSVEVVAAVCPDGDLGSAVTPRLAQEFIASQLQLPLEPQAQGEGFLLTPAINRRYTLDLSDAQRYCAEGKWRRFTLSLPTPEDPGRENWVVICCHAPLTPSGAAVQLAFDRGYLMADGVAPAIIRGDFDVTCTYSPAAGGWLVGIVQYAVSGEAV